MSDLRRQKQNELLEHVEQMVRYWASEEGESNVPPQTSKLDALAGLAFSILVMLDGGAAVGPYVVVPISDDGSLLLGSDGKVLDIAGELHELQKEVSERMAYERSKLEVRPDGPETAEGGLIGQEPY